MHVHKLIHTVLDICIYIYIFVNVLNVCKKSATISPNAVFFSCLFLFLLCMCSTWDIFFLFCFVFFSFLFALRSPWCCNVLSAILFLSPYHISTTDKARVFAFFYTKSSISFGYYTKCRRTIWGRKQVNELKDRCDIFQVKSIFNKENNNNEIIWAIREKTNLIE